MVTDGGEESDAGEDPSDGSDLPAAERLRDRVHPVISSLTAGLKSSDPETVEHCGIALCLVARSTPGKASTIISQLVEDIAAEPKSKPLYRTLAGLIGDHGREIRGALMTETGYSDARQIYGRIEHVDPWELSAVEIEPDTEDAEPTFFSAVMRLVELDERGRDPLDSDAWTRFIQRLPGEGGESATEGDVERAAERQDSRPRTVRKRHERIQQIAASRIFVAIESRSRFDELEVLAPVSEQRFAHVIRTRGRIGAEEYAIAIRLCKQRNEPAFRKRLTDSLAEWARIDERGVVRVVDWGETPRPWVATEFVDRRLPSQQLTPVEGLEHARTLTRALVEIHRHGIVHGGIDPQTVGYPPNTLDGVVEPMLDDVGLLPVYRRYVDTGAFLDVRYAAPEALDDQYGRIDHASDIYQLGMVLYRALTGRPPFDTVEEIERRVCQEQPPPPTDQNPDLPAGIDEIIQKATAKQKLLRYETALQFHTALRSLCDENI